MALARECGLQHVHLGDTQKAEVFGCRQTPHPASAGFFHSLLNVTGLGTLATARNGTGLGAAKRPRLWRGASGTPGPVPLEPHLTDGPDHP
jgi:hypothetical protein